MTLADDLKTLLANTVSLYLRAHGYHWNVEGPDFREYHGLFEEIYTDLYESVDLVAENIRKLGDYAPYRLERFVELKTLTEGTVSTDAKTMAKDLCDALENYITDLKTGVTKATDADEHGIANFLADRVDVCQKWCWFLRASTK